MILVIKKVRVLKSDISGKSAVYKVFCRRRYAGGVVFSDKRLECGVICRKMSKPVCCGFRQNDLCHGFLSEKKFSKLKFCGF